MDGYSSLPRKIKALYEFYQKSEETATTITTELQNNSGKHAEKEMDSNVHCEIAARRKELEIDKFKS